MGNILKTIARHAVGAIAGSGASVVLAPALAGSISAQGDDPVAAIATGIALMVYAAVEKALKPMWAKLGEQQ